jgi:hypothetical protein
LTRRRTTRRFGRAEELLDERLRLELRARDLEAGRLFFEDARRLRAAPPVTYISTAPQPSPPVRRRDRLERFLGALREDLACLDFDAGFRPRRAPPVRAADPATISQ